MAAALTVSVPPASIQPQAGAGARAVTAPDEASALAAARARGRQVEALADRTAYSQTFANPTGTLTLDESIAPVRVQRPDGSWVPVDTTLRVAADGNLTPMASEVSLAFSEGGSGPLAKLAKGGAELILGWPGKLPAPHVSGDTAIYPAVLLGVDLKVTAQPMGFSEQLLVRTPDAARKLTLATLGLTTSGVTLRRTPAGGLSAVDAYDQELFTAPAPTMWDSSGSRAPVEVRVSEGQLDLVPNLGMLTNPATRFPVTIDPTFSWTGASASSQSSWVPWTGVQQAWTKVDACFPDQTYFRGANDSDPGHNGAVKVGRAGADDSGDPPQCSGTLWRSYFQMDTRRVVGKVVHSASFYVYETYSSSCNGKPVDLYSSGGISASTDWRNKPGTSFIAERRFAHGHDSRCGQSWEQFDATQTAEKAADNGWGNITLMLRAPDEGVCYDAQDGCQWKRFDSGAINDSHTPFLQVEYNTPPNAPSGLYTEGSPYLYPPDGRIPCGSGPFFVGTTTPTLHADISDPDDTASSQQQSLRADYTWQVGSVSHTPSTPPEGKPGPGNTSFATKVTIPGGQLHNGDNVSWHAVTNDGLTNGPVSADCHLTVDSTVVNDPPAVTSSDNLYPNGSCLPAGCTMVGTPGQFEFTPGNPADDVAGYLYGVNTGVPWKFVRATGTANSAAVTIVPQQVGDNQLIVQVVSRGGRLGATAGYDLRTGHPSQGGALVARWTMDAGSGTSLVDSVGGHDATAAGTFAWTTGRTGDGGDSALQLTRDSQTSGGYAATQEPSVDTQNGFTVSAWVNLTDTAHYFTVVSQDGKNVGAFFLEFLGGNTNRWSFTFSEADTAVPQMIHAYSDSAPTPGAWTHLVAVYCDDVSCGAPGGQAVLYLYVGQGSAAPTLQSHPVSFTPSPWRSNGSTQIGRELNGGYVDYLNGAVDDVALFWGDPCSVPVSAGSTCAIP
jgi:hypothetical protein